MFSLTGTRYFTNSQQWLSDFMTRYQATVAEIPPQTYDQVSNNMRTWAINWASGMEYYNRNAATWMHNEYQGGGFMRWQEWRLNVLGRHILPITWKTPKCGTAFVPLADCGQP